MSQDRKVAALNTHCLCGGFLLFMYPDEYFMKLALSEAEKAMREGEVPVGCVLVENDRIIGKGRNTRQRDNDISGHAEINALKDAASLQKVWRFPRATAYVTLEPCPMCASALQQAHVSRIVFGAPDEKYGACGGSFDLFLQPNLGYYPFLTSEVLSNECRQLLQSYFHQKRTE